MSRRKIFSPNVLPEVAVYWQAANAGRLLIKHCSACDKPHHYPRDICPHCLSQATQWREASGSGTLYSFSSMGTGEAAYTLAMVTLDEGVTMLSNVVDADPAGLRIGQRLKVVFLPSENGQAVPMFSPA